MDNKKTDYQLIIIHLSDPDEIRTHDPRLRRALLYPAELPDQKAFKNPPVSAEIFYFKSAAKVVFFL